MTVPTDPPTNGSFSLNPATIALDPVPLDATQIVEGSPEISERVIWSSGDGSHVRGVWQITPGVVTDVEVDESFVVLWGRATIAVESGPTIHVGPGSVCILEPGARTTWHVHEALRKVFEVTVEPSTDRSS